MTVDILDTGTAQDGYQLRPDIGFLGNGMAGGIDVWVWRRRLQFHWVLCLCREPVQSQDAMEPTLLATLPPCRRHQAPQPKASAAAAELISQLP